MKWINTAIGAVIAVSAIPMIVKAVNDLTGDGKDLDGTIAGTLLDFAPLVFVAGILTYLFTAVGFRKNS